MQNRNPQDIYRGQIEQLNILEKRLIQSRRVLSWLRFLSLVASFFVLWQFWSAGAVPAFAGFAILFALFLFAVLKDLKKKDEVENASLLIEINKQEIEILNHHFSTLQDGHQMNPESHAYANDLDIFGKASVYQYINRTVSEQGNRTFADWLLNPAEPEVILQRQEAAKELTNQIEWRQQLRAYGMKKPLTLSAEKKVGIWLKTENKFINSLYWKITRVLLPAITLTVLALYLFGNLSSSIFFPLTILFFAIASAITKIVMPHYLLLDKIVTELETLQNSIRWIEEASFKSEWLNQLKNNFTGNTGKASGTIKKLKNIMERFDYRFNPIVHIPLNTFLLWDLQQIVILEKWKTDCNQDITRWFHAVGQAEALITISTLSFNHPQWCYPSLSNEQGVFFARDLGHPLIPSWKRVTNSFSTAGEKQLNLVTGSNMAGKSTFLRSVGVNIVLAMMGAANCSSQSEISPMKVMSSMRVSDNLEENTSTFYAELKKLKEIIDALNNKEKVFLLLDEILRGTNSADRHAGSIALIKQLIHQNASGLIATHDLELTKLSDEFPGHVHNYHFDVQVKNEELYFDYKIKPGICTSMNAFLLMKKIGIEL